MNNIGLVFATKIEAKHFITGLGLQKIEKKPFNIYFRDRIYLVIGGIGKSNAAISTSYIINKYGIDLICNMGAAGSTTIKQKVGDIFHIDTVIEYDRPKILTGGLRTLKPDVLGGFDTATLATQDKAVVCEPERTAVSKHADLVDMEGAAVVHACRLWDVKCHLFKVVTDTPEHKEAEIIKNVYSTAKDMFKFFESRVLTIYTGNADL